MTPSPEESAEVAFRRATPDDAAAILAAHLDSIRAIGPRYYPAAIVDAWAADLSADVYVRAMHGGEAFFVAIGTLDGRPAVLGFSTHRRDDDRDGTSAYVRGDAARRGVGSTLLRMAETHAREHGVREVRIEASLAGVEFYRRHGYEEEGGGAVTLRGGQAMACVFMRKQLA